jgi:hypothetical protein
MIIGDVDINKLKSKVRNAMRKATPKDTGNLAYNALRTYQIKDGIKCIYHGNIAGYGKILNQSIMVGSNKNKHFGWHARAVSNSVTVIVREFSPKAKGYRLYNNRQVSFKERSDSLQDSQERMAQQQYKWQMNQAKKRFEQENPMG